MTPHPHIWNDNPDFAEAVCVWIYYYLFFPCAFWTFGAAWWLSRKSQKMQIPENKEWYVYTSLSAGGMKLSARLWLCEIEGDSKPTRLWIWFAVCEFTHSPHCFLRKSELTWKFSDVCFTRGSDAEKRTLAMPNWEPEHKMCMSLWRSFLHISCCWMKGSKDAFCVCIYMQFS